MPSNCPPVTRQKLADDAKALRTETAKAERLWNRYRETQLREDGDALWAWSVRQPQNILGFDDLAKAADYRRLVGGERDSAVARFESILKFLDDTAGQWEACAGRPEVGIVSWQR